jgi:hypothetical protein
MQSRGTSDWLRGRRMSWVDWVVALSSSQMADERQSAVLGQVSSATLSLMIRLNYTAGLAFMLIDNKRFEPCVWVFWAIALGAQAFTKAATRRQSVDLRTRIEVQSWGGIVSFRRGGQPTSGGPPPFSCLATCTLISGWTWSQ